MKEKLIELLKHEPCPSPYPFECPMDCKYNHESGEDCFAERYADYLIANGVTVRKRAKWDDSGRYQFMDGTKAIRCTECGCALTEIEYQKYFYNFCPVCGADMRGDT